MALTLFHYEGMSQSEVASVMGISDEAVELLLGRARAAVKSGITGPSGKPCWCKTVLRTSEAYER